MTIVEILTVLSRRLNVPPSDVTGALLMRAEDATLPEEHRTQCLDLRRALLDQAHAFKRSLHLTVRVLDCLPASVPEPVE